MNYFRNNNKNLKPYIFIFIAVVFFVIGFILYSVCYNNFLSWYLDSFISYTGGDLFLSLKYCEGLSPYMLASKSVPFPYPPLIVILYYFMSRIVDIEKINILQQLYTQRYIFLLVFLAILKVMIIMYLISKNQSKNDDKYNNEKVLLATFLFVVSYPMLYAFERCNIIVVSFIFVLAFLIFFKNDSLLIKNLAILCLAISANIKLYPALYGLLLITIDNKRWIKIAIIYGVLLFVIPFLFLGNGFFNEISAFLNEFTSYSEAAEGLKHNLSLMGVTYTFLNCINFVNWRIIYYILFGFASVVLISNTILEIKMYKKLFYIYILIICIGRVPRYVHIFALLPILYIIFNELKLNFDNLLISIICLTFTVYFQFLKFNLLFSMYIVLFICVVYVLKEFANNVHRIINSSKVNES